MQGVVPGRPAMMHCSYIDWLLFAILHVMKIFTSNVWLKLVMLQ
jgi:hypothetical protein